MLKWYLLLFFTSLNFSATSQYVIQGKITDLEASIIDLKGTWRYEKRETLKARKKAARDADLKLCEVKKLAHEQEVRA